MKTTGALLTETHGWAAARQWRFRCLLCPAGQGELVAHSHPDLNRVHDHLVQAHGVSFDAFFHCRHEHLDGSRTHWRLPDGRLWLEVTARPDE
jgi:hypothetical protein